MINYLSVALGGAVGSVLRFFLSGVIARHYGESFPLGTLLINISGSFLIGLIAELTGPGSPFLVSSHLRDALLIGLLGGYTTFSSFSLQTMNLAREGEIARAGLNVLLSVVICLLAVWLGQTLGRFWLNLRAV